MAAITLRPVEQQDRAVVLELQPRIEQQQLIPDVSTSLDYADSHPGCIPYMIVHGETPVGFFVWCVQESTARLVGFFIDQTFQRRGYARQAVTQMHDLARKAQVRRIAATMHPANIGAERFYLKMGFTPSGETLDDEAVYVCDVRNASGGSGL
ncbi:MAG: GNAT family N-acetyltransferase [Anaerolineae bacterium]